MSDVSKKSGADAMLVYPPLLGVLNLLTFFAGWVLHDFIRVKAQAMALHAGLAAMVVAGTVVFAYRRYRLASDTPTSKIRSAPQGYVELSGRAQLDPEFQPVHGVSCIWFRYVISEKVGKTSRQVSLQEEGRLIIDDGTGSCLIELKDAEFGVNNWLWREGKWSHYLSFIKPGERIYAMGEFTSKGSADHAAQARAVATKVLGVWKKDRAWMLQRFDADRSGTVDDGELEAARIAAAQAAEAHVLREAGGQADRMRAPRDGRPYLIANADPFTVLEKYRKHPVRAAIFWIVWLGLFWGYFYRG